MKKKKNLKAAWLGLTPILLIPIIAASCSKDNKNQDLQGFNKKTATVYKIDAVLSQLMDERSLEGLTPEEQVVYKEELQTLNQRYLSLVNDLNANKLDEQVAMNLKKDVDAKATKILKSNSNEKYVKELEDSLYSLRSEISNLKKSNDTYKNENEALQQANKALIDKHTQEIEDMKAQLKEAIENAVDPDLEPIAKTSTSAKGFLKLLSDFLLKDFFGKLKKEFPQTYKHDETLIAQIVQSFDATNKSIAKLAENKNNLAEFEKLTLFTIKRVSLIFQYVKPEEGSITLDNPKSEYFDTLFDWRMKDLAAAIKSVTNKEVNTFKGDNAEEKTKNKNKIIEQLTNLHDSYKTAKTQADTLQKQVIYFSILDDEEHFEAALSQDKRSFSSKYNAQDVKISEFPIIQEITDQEFLDLVYREFHEIALKLSNHIKQHGDEYIRSVKFHKLYKNFTDNVNNIIRMLRDKKSLKYFNDLVYKQDLDKFLRKMKNIYYEVLKIDTSKEIKKEMQEYKSFVDTQVAMNNPNNFYGFFKKNVIDVRNKLDENDNKRIFIYQQFATNIDAEIKKMRDWTPKTFIEAYDRLINFMLIKSRVEMILQIIKLYDVTGDNLNDKTFKELVKYDLSEKFDKNIKNSEAVITNLETEIKDINTLINSIVPVPNNNDLTSDATYRIFIEKMADQMLQILKTCETNFGADGKWKYVFESPNTLINLLNELNQKIIALNSSKESKNLELLKSEFEKIKEEHHKIKIVLNGDDHPSFNGSLNKAIIDAYANEAETKAAKDLFNKVKTSLQNVQVTSDIATKENATSILNQWKTSLESLKTEVDQSTQYGKPFAILADVDNFTLKTSLSKIIDDLLAKITALLSTVDQKEIKDIKNSLEQIVNVSKEALAKFGSETDGQTSPLFKENLEAIESEKNNLESFKRRKEKNAKLAVLVPGQELFVLLRSFQNKQLTDLDAIMIPEKYQDKKLLEIIRNPFENLKKSEVVSGVWSLKGDDKNFDISDPELVNNETEKTLYEKMRKLEDAYAASILKLVNSTDETKNADLADFKKKREAYYNYLNDLHDSKKVYLTNHHARFTADLYRRPEPSEGTVGYTAYNLVNDFATLVAIDNMMTFLNEQFINPKKAS
ncbi:hypothetical protein [Ureaplasma zalophigenitalium]|uniref:Lipoprotein n=1 Tax=Ureaplasma zalophigenitalium TaxID=907723 RepID=A0ABT3BPZ8_9BACT|nr:hypothetical protein [Ureaplasma zalophigenitalium]MCV3754329.1 hypothetical protein [Ureaplasma zalophigenitalium]